MAEKKPRREPIILSQMRPWTLLLVLCGCILFTFILIHFRFVLNFFGKILSALGPVIAGAIFAYLLNPPATWLDKRLRKLLSKLFKKEQTGRVAARAISSFLVVLIFVASIAGLIIATSSEVIAGISTLLNHIPQYLDTLTRWAEELLSADNYISDYLSQFAERMQKDLDTIDTADVSAKIFSLIATGAAGTLGFIYNVLIGFIIAVYLLISKERFGRQFKQILFALIKPKTAFWINDRMRRANKTFGTAVLGKLVDSIIIGFLCFLGMLIMDMPYTVLITVIVGVTNMIPFFGPILGAIPCTLLVLMENPMKALYFAIFILCLQQFDCNILDPRIVGGSIGLPAFWELFACLLGGGLFGLVGMAVGVPAFAVLYHLIKELVAERLQERDLPEDFLRNELSITPKPLQSGLFDEPEPNSQYVQHLILLEDISQVPASPTAKEQSVSSQSQTDAQE